MEVRQLLFPFLTRRMDALIGSVFFGWGFTSESDQASWGGMMAWGVSGQACVCMPLCVWHFLSHTVVRQGGTTHMHIACLIIPGGMLCLSAHAHGLF